MLELSDLDHESLTADWPDTVPEVGLKTLAHDQQLTLTPLSDLATNSCAILVQRALFRTLLLALIASSGWIVKQQPFDPSNI